MTEARGKSEREIPSAETPQKQKRAYRKPSFRCEQVFETILSCTKFADTGGQCKFNPKNS